MSFKTSYIIKTLKLQYSKNIISIVDYIIYLPRKRINNNLS